MSIWYGDNVADDSELRLCGDIAGKRVLELGIASTSNADHNGRCRAPRPSPSTHRPTRSPGCAPPPRRPRSRSSATTASSPISASSRSGSIDLVIAAHTLANIDDLPRLLRQVHRVLRLGAPVRRRHAPPGRGDVRRRRSHRAAAYGADGVTFSELYMAFERTNFHFDAMYELNTRHVRDAVAPSVLVLRARKQGN